MLPLLPYVPDSARQSCERSDSKWWMVVASLMVVLLSVCCLWLEWTGMGLDFAIFFELAKLIRFKELARMNNDFDEFYLYFTAYDWIDSLGCWVYPGTRKL
jgi:hypothetical protein